LGPFLLGAKPPDGGAGGGGKNQAVAGKAKCVRKTGTGPWGKKKKYSPNTVAEWEHGNSELKNKPPVLAED